MASQALLSGFRVRPIRLPGLSTQNWLFLWGGGGGGRGGGGRGGAGGGGGGAGGGRGGAGGGQGGAGGGGGDKTFVLNATSFCSSRAPQSLSSKPNQELS